MPLAKLPDIKVKPERINPRTVSSRLERSMKLAEKEVEIDGQVMGPFAPQPFTSFQEGGSVTAMNFMPMDGGGYLPPRYLGQAFADQDFGPLPDPIYIPPTPVEPYPDFEPVFEPQPMDFQAFADAGAEADYVTPNRFDPAALEPDRYWFNEQTPPEPRDGGFFNITENEPGFGPAFDPTRDRHPLGAEVPFLRDVIQPAMGDFGEFFGERLVPAVVPGASFVPENIRGGVGRTIGEAVVPVRQGELAAEFVPGLGTIPDVARGGRTLFRSAFREAVTPEPRVLRLGAQPNALVPDVSPQNIDAGAMVISDPAGVRILGPNDPLAPGELEMFHGTAGPAFDALREGSFVTPSRYNAAVFGDIDSGIRAEPAGPLRRLFGEESGPARVPGRVEEAMATGQLPEGGYTFNPNRRGGQPPVEPPPAAASDLPEIAGGAPPPPFPRPSVLTSVDDIARDVEHGARAFEESLVGKIGQLPVVKTAVNAINPSALTADPPAELVKALGQDGAIKIMSQTLAHTRKVDAGNYLASSIEDGIRQAFRAAGFTMQDGRVGGIKGNPMPLIGDLMENPSKYSGLDAKQRKFIFDVGAVLDDMNQAEKRAGVKKGEIFSGDGLYFPRHVVSVRGVANTRPPVARSPAGTTQGFQKGRYWDTMEEAANKGGVQYSSDPAALVGTRIRAGIKAVADRELGDLIKPLGRTRPPAARMGEMGTMIPAAGNRIFDQDVAKFLTDSFGVQQVNRAGAAVSTANSAMRAAMLTGDMSYLTLQGFATLARNPVAFGKALGAAIDAVVLDGRAYGRYVQSNAREIERFVGSGLTWRNTGISFETAAQSARGVGGKAGGLLSAALSKGPLGRLGAGFENAMNVAALENAKGIAGVIGSNPSLMTRAAQKVFGLGLKDISGKTTDQVAASIANKMTGRLSSRALGVKGTQQWVEQNGLLAANYHRAALGLLGDALQGGLRGAEARRVLAGLFTGIAATHAALSYATGEEPQFNPLERKAFENHIGGDWVSIGGPLPGYIRTAVQSKDKIEGKHGESFAGDLTRLDTSGSESNPILRNLRGKPSPLLALITDMIANENFEGDPVRDSLGQAAGRIGESFLPISAQDPVKAAIAGDPIDWERAGYNFVGARNYQESASEERSRFGGGILDRAAGELGWPEEFKAEVLKAAEQGYANLGPREKDIVNAGLPDSTHKRLDEQAQFFEGARKTQVEQIVDTWYDIPTSKGKDEYLASVEQEFPKLIGMVREELNPTSAIGQLLEGYYDVKFQERPKYLDEVEKTFGPAVLGRLLFNVQPKAGAK